MNPLTRKIARPRPGRKLVHAMLLSAAMVFSACSQRSEGDGLAQARALMDRHELAAATIELKNVLQEYPQSGPARFMLGKLMFEMGDPLGAEAELTRALEDKALEHQVVPVLARVLASLGKTESLLQQFGSLALSDAAAGAELKSQIAGVYLSRGMLDDAGQAIDEALKLAPEHPSAWVARARWMAARGDRAAALAHVQTLLERAPKEAEAWLQKADLLLPSGPGDTAAAADAYRKAVSLQPDLVAGHVALLTLLLDGQQLDAATTQWASMKKAVPWHPQTRYFEAALALQKGDATRTREITQHMLRNAPNNPRLLLLAGHAELQLNSLPQAEALLSKAAKASPKAAPPRHLLAEVYLQMGQADRALSALAPLLEPKVRDAQTLALAGRAQLMTGDLKAAGSSFAQALKSNPEDGRIRTAAAMVKLNAGQTQLAITELQAIAKSDTGTTADLALVNEHLKRNEPDAAIAALDTLATKLPGQAITDLLRGRIALQRKDVAAARKSFEAALVKESGFYPAAANLAALDAAEGKVDAAKQRLQAIREQQPGNAQVRLTLATLLAKSGGTRAETIKLLDEAVKAKTDDATAQAALIDIHMASGDNEAALHAATAAVTVLPDNMDLLDRLGLLQLRSGDTYQALQTFNRMDTLRPNSALPQLRLTAAQLANNNLGAAAANQRRAAKASPQSLAIQRQGIVLALREKRPAQALVIARTVQAQHPNEMYGYMVEGDIELMQRRFEPAAAAFRKALGKVQSPADAQVPVPMTLAAKRLHLALIGAKKGSEADAMAEAWRKDHPKDLAFIVHLGDLALMRADLAQAEQRYREVLSQQPDNPQAMNNVAYLLVKQRKPGALAMAERAVKLAPDQPALLDTLALVHADAKRYDKAIEWQTKAVDLAPQSGGLRLTLAKLYLLAKNRDGARAELDKLAQHGTAFVQHAEVAQLLKQLGG